MDDRRPRLLDYGVQKSPSEDADVKRRVRRLLIVIGVAWITVFFALMIYRLIVNDPSE